MQLRGLGKWSLLVEAIREDCLQEAAPIHLAQLPSAPGQVAWTAGWHTCIWREPHLPAWGRTARSGLGCDL